MKKQRVPSDAVVYILAMLGPYARFVSNQIFLSSAFYYFSKMDEFKDLLKDFTFLPDDCYRSDQVSHAFSRLIFSDLLNYIMNRNLYEVTPELAAKDPGEYFSEEEIALLKKATKEFEKFVGVERIKICECQKKSQK